MNDRDKPSWTKHFTRGPKERHWFFGVKDVEQQGGVARTRRYPEAFGEHIADGSLEVVEVGSGSPFVCRCDHCRIEIDRVYLAANASGKRARKSAVAAAKFSDVTGCRTKSERVKNPRNIKKRFPEFLRGHAALSKFHKNDTT
jgi:hypothetical protein